jgi:hypothetical protein
MKRNGRLKFTYNERIIAQPLKVIVTAERFLKPFRIRRTIKSVDKGLGPE